MIHNVHERRLPADATTVGEILETLAGPSDRLWRSRVVAPMHLDRGLAIGSTGGHGPIRYTVIAHEPGWLVRFRLRPGPLRGTHEFTILPCPDVDTSGPPAEPLAPNTPGPLDGVAPSAGIDTSDRAAGPVCVLRHTLDVEVTPAGRFVWPIVRRIHDAAVEDMLDAVEKDLSGTAHRGQRTPAWVRVAGRALRMRGRWVECAPLAPGPLLVEALPRIDYGDRWVTPLRPGDSTDPVVWARAVFGRRVPGVSVLLRVRDLIVRPLGLRTLPAELPPTGLPLIASSRTEALLGADDRHLSFRVAVDVHDDVSAPRVAGVSTTVQIHNGLGRAYWAVVRWFHPGVVRAMLRTVPLPGPRDT